MKSSLLTRLALSIVCVATLWGCGGGGSSSNSSGTQSTGSTDGRATMQFTVLWTTVTPSTATAPQSVNIVLTAPDGTTLTQQAISHTAWSTPSTVTFINQPVEQITATATSYDATGTVLGVATVAVNSSASAVVTTPLSFSPTISRVSVLPIPTLAAHTNAPLLASAYDASGNVVITSPMNWAFFSSNFNVADAMPSGTNANMTWTLRTQGGGQTTVTAEIYPTRVKNTAVATVTGPTFPPNPPAPQ